MLPVVPGIWAGPIARSGTVVVSTVFRYMRAMARDLPASLEEHYHATWFEYVDADGRRFVARPVDARPPAPPTWDLPEAFDVVTAWNPDSTPRSRRENDAANERLHAELVARDATVRGILGHSADRAWEEHSFAVWDVPFDEVSRLAAAYGQHAIFVVERGWRTLGDGASRVGADRGVWLIVDDQSD
jgi:hypothetical protein